MSVWIARNKDGTLDAYKVEPQRGSNNFRVDCPTDWLDYLDDEDYPEATWENSPKELKIMED